ncbi:MAG TPA: tautomerase family protein [Clostridia bacterium]|nr:tautomerase family protein [Clostridia bacterium]
MPHVIVKMYKGRSEALKKDMAEKVTKAITESLSVNESSVSIAIEEFETENWDKEVYEPDIIGKSETLYKKPGYTPGK